MSEAVFLFVQLLAVLRIEHAARAGDDRAGPGQAWLAGLLTAAAILIRTAGVTILAAGLIYLARKRQWRSAAVFGAAAILAVLPWWLYARAHAPARADLIDHGGLMAVAYADQFWTSEAGTVTARPVGADHLPARVVGNLANIAIRDVGGIVTPLLFRTPGESGLEVIGLGPPEGGKVPSMGSAVGTKVVSLALTLIAGLGFVVAWRRRATVAEWLVPLAIAMIALWPFWTFRFLLPLVPFLFGYLVMGAEALAHAIGRVSPRRVLDPAAAVRTFMCVLIGLNAIDHTQYIAQAYGAPRGVPWKAHAAEIGEMLSWLRQHATDDGVIASDNPALVYLHTGHRTVAIDSFEDMWTRWNRLGVRYVASLSDGVPPSGPRVDMIFKHPDRNLWVAEIAPADRGGQSQAPGG
jgi:hypothetical protein